MMPDGVEQAVADGDLALHQLPPDGGWRPAALELRGEAHALLGATDRATDDLTAAIEAGLAGGAAEVVILAQAQLALLAANQGAWGEAGQRARAAQALVEERGLGDYSTSALAHVAMARVALHEARPEDARASLTRAHRLRPLLDYGLPG
jgi:LuxR family maltose regulon positive regulatory protein